MHFMLHCRFYEAQRRTMVRKINTINGLNVGTLEDIQDAGAESSVIERTLNQLIGQGPRGAGEEQDSQMRQLVLAFIARSMLKRDAVVRRRSRRARR